MVLSTLKNNLVVNDQGVSKHIDGVYLWITICDYTSTKPMSEVKQNILEIRSIRTCKQGSQRLQRIHGIMVWKWKVVLERTISSQFVTCIDFKILLMFLQQMSQLGYHRKYFSYSFYHNSKG